MKILILGAKGNLGQHLVEIFNSYEIIVWDREEIDITDRKLVLEKISSESPNVIINAAAYNAVDKCENDEKELELAKKINGEAIGYLVEAAIKNDAVLIHYSTDYVFDGENKSGYKETDEPRPINKYGESKLIGENEILKFKDRWLKFYLIRTARLFGQQGLSEAAKPSFFDTMLKLAETRNELEIVNDEIGCFTYTPDLAKATKELLEGEYEYGVYHIMNSGFCSWYESAQELFKLAGNNNIILKPVFGDKFLRPAKRPKFSGLINTKLKPLRTWQGALKEYSERTR